jgi:serine phosphatase RsbU (regulator of sigma subunit)
MFVFLGLAVQAQSQQDIRLPFQLSGTVYGYYFQPSGFLKKEMVEMEGTLGGATIKFFQKSRQIAVTQTSANGRFAVDLPAGSFVVEITRTGYLSDKLILELPNIPVDETIQFQGLEILMNRNTALPAHTAAIGTLRYNTQRNTFEFSPDKERNTQHKGQADNAVELLSRAVVKYETAVVRAETPEHNSEIPEVVQPVKPQINKTSPKTVAPSPVSDNTEPTMEPTLELSPFEVLFGENPESLSLSDRRDRIHQAEQELERLKRKARNRLDSLMISNREKEIALARQDLKDAEITIEAQEAFIEKIRLRNLLLVGLIAVLLIIGFFLIRFMRSRNKARYLLEKKLKEVDESIRFARRIQKSALIPESRLAEFLPDAFVLDMPRSVVSGDTYWLTKRENKTIAAVIDCTGHGVPGALLSSMVNTLLNQIVVEEGHWDPGTILSHLHAGIFHGLRQNEDESMSQAGMDMSLVLVDQSSRDIRFATAFNPVIVVNADGITEYKTDLQSVGGKSLRPDSDDSHRTFTTGNIPWQEGATIYMFTDGFADQLGGDDERKKKLGSKRVKETLIRSHNHQARHRKAELLDLFKKWQGKHRQTDDVVVLGFTVHA